MEQTDNCLRRKGRRDWKRLAKEPGHMDTDSNVVKTGVGQGLCGG